MRKYLATIVNAAMIYFLLFAILVSVSGLGFFGYMAVFLMYAACLLVRCYYTKVGYYITKFNTLVACNALVFMGVASLFERQILMRENWLKTGDYLEAFVLGSQALFAVIPTYIIISLVLRYSEYLYNAWRIGNKANIWTIYRKWEIIGFLVMIAWFSFVTVARAFILALS